MQSVAAVFGYSNLEGLALIPQLQKYVAGEITAEEALSNAEKQEMKSEGTAVIFCLVAVIRFEYRVCLKLWQALF